ncbi:hypothetical protein C8Q70DRAFT_936345 [Cubamyces menziesii]|nr:hypothetical protein C8Q70DRAFT_936345 [Cubamyces menziesii]
MTFTQAQSKSEDEDERESGFVMRICKDAVLSSLLIWHKASSLMLEVAQRPDSHVCNNDNEYRTAKTGISITKWVQSSRKQLHTIKAATIPASVQSRKLNLVFGWDEISSSSPSPQHAIHVASEARPRAKAAGNAHQQIVSTSPARYLRMKGSIDLLLSTWKWTHLSIRCQGSHWQQNGTLSLTMRWPMRTRRAGTKAAGQCQEDDGVKWVLNTSESPMTRSAEALQQAWFGLELLIRVSQLLQGIHRILARSLSQYRRVQYSSLVNTGIMISAPETLRLPRPLKYIWQVCDFVVFSCLTLRPMNGSRMSGWCNV